MGTADNIRVDRTLSGNDGYCMSPGHGCIRHGATSASVSESTTGGGWKLVSREQWDTRGNGGKTHGPYLLASERLPEEESFGTLEQYHYPFPERAPSRRGEAPTRYGARFLYFIVWRAPPKRERHPSTYVHSSEMAHFKLDATTL